MKQRAPQNVVSSVQAPQKAVSSVQAPQYDEEKAKTSWLTLTEEWAAYLQHDQKLLKGAP
jgi:hypothetical protein